MLLIEQTSCGTRSPLPAGERSILAFGEDRVRGARSSMSNDWPIPLTPSLSPPGRGSRLRLVASRAADVLSLSPQTIVAKADQRTRFPSPLVGEGGPSRRRGPGEGFCSRAFARYPSPGSLLARARNDPPSPTRGEGKRV